MLVGAADAGGLVALAMTFFRLTAMPLIVSCRPGFVTVIALLHLVLSSRLGAPGQGDELHGCNVV